MHVVVFSVCPGARLGRKFEFTGFRHQNFSTLKRNYQEQKTVGDRLSQGTAKTWLSPIVLAQRMRKQHPFLP